MKILLRFKLFAVAILFILPLSIFIGWLDENWFPLGGAMVIVCGGLANIVVTLANNNRMPVVVSVARRVCIQIPNPKTYVLADETTKYPFLADRFNIFGVYASVGDFLAIGGLLFMLTNTWLDIFHHVVLKS